MIRLSSVIFLLVLSNAAKANDDQVTCKYITSKGQEEAFIFGDEWAVHRYYGAETNKPHQIDYECWLIGFKCWDYDAPRFKVLERKGDVVISAFGNIESPPPIVVVYDVSCDD